MTKGEKFTIDIEPFDEISTALMNPVKAFNVPDAKSQYYVKVPETAFQASPFLMECADYLASHAIGWKEQYTTGRNGKVRTEPTFITANSTIKPIIVFGEQCDEVPSLEWFIMKERCEFWRVSPELMLCDRPLRICCNIITIQPMHRRPAITRLELYSVMILGDLTKFEIAQKAIDDQKKMIDGDQD